MYTCLTLLLGFIQRFVSPLGQLCSSSHCLSSTRSHLTNTTVICCFQSCVCFIAFLSGVCMLEFMLTNNNQLPSFFSTRLPKTTGRTEPCSASPSAPPSLRHPPSPCASGSAVTAGNQSWSMQNRPTRCQMFHPVMFCLPCLLHWLIPWFSVQYWDLLRVGLQVYWVYSSIFSPFEISVKLAMKGCIAGNSKLHAKLFIN